MVPVSVISRVTHDSHDRGTLNRRTTSSRSPSTRSAATCLVSVGRTAGATGGGAPAGSGNRSANSRTISLASSPIACAYDRTNARLNIPVGHRDTSSRSSASRRDRLILVVSAIDFREICRRSRSCRRRGPKLAAGSILEILTTFVQRARLRRNRQINNNRITTRPAAQIRQSRCM